MINTHFHPLGLYDYRAYIANESFARTLIKNIRWPDGITCQNCSGKKIWRIGTDYQCGRCTAHFSDTSGTIFAKSHLTISQWIIAVGLFKIGVNALGLQWALGCHYRSARRALHLIRTVVAKDPILQQLSGEIEVDETYYGGRRKGKRGRGARGKTIVLGFKERRGRIKTVVIPNVKKRTLEWMIAKHIKTGSTIYSDGFMGYDDVYKRGYQHLPFDHTTQFIKTDVIHTQGIEGHWGHTKPITKSRYRKLTKKNLPGICAENDFKANHRKDSDFIRLVLRNLLQFHPLNA
jgi:transposase-like protein